MTTTQLHGRSPIHAYLSDDSHGNWHDFAAAHGVSVSALLEELGQEINPKKMGEDFDINLAVNLATIIKRARKTDARRRRRSGTRS